MIPKRPSEEQLAISATILAHVLHGIDGSKSLEEWHKHCVDTGHDAKAFFGTNTKGYDEYVQFIAQRDKDAHEKRQAQKEMKGIKR